MVAIAMAASVVCQLVLSTRSGSWQYRKAVTQERLNYPAGAAISGSYQPHDELSDIVLTAGLVANYLKRSYSEVS